MSGDTSQSRLDRMLRFLESDPDNLRLLGDAADAAIELRDHGKALALIDKALSLQPGDPSSTYKRGCVELLAGKLDHAEATFRELVSGKPGQSASGKPDASEFRMMLGRVLLLKGRYADAKSELAAALPAAARVPEIAALYLRALHYLGEVDQAIAFAEQALEGNPRDAEMLALLSTLYVDSGNMEKAEATALRSMEAQAGIPEALTTLGTVALGAQRGEEASSRFAAALERNPRSGRAWVGQGLAQMYALDLARAEASLKRGVENMPSHIGSWHALAWCQMMKQDLAGAEASFAKALELDRNFSESHGGLAVLAAMRGDDASAKPLIERALRLDGQSFSGRYAQSLLLRKSRPEAADRLTKELTGSIRFPDGRPMLSALKRSPKRPQ